MPSQKASTASASPSRAIAGSISRQTASMIGVLVAVASGGRACAPRKVVATETGALVAEPARGAQHARLGFEDRARSRI